MDDRELLQRIRLGDEEAFASLFRAHYAALVGAAESLLRERSQAEDIVQDVMLELWRRRDALAIDDSFRAYLYRATRNRALNMLRHDRVERRSEPLLGGDRTAPATAHAHLVEEEIDAAVRRTIAALPAPQREVFELSRVHGLKYAEIAGVLGISVKTVEARMGKALSALREGLEPWMGGLKGKR